MFDFGKIADGLYSLYIGGERVTPFPLTRQELDEAIIELPLSEADARLVDSFYDTPNMNIPLLPPPVAT